MAYLDVQTLAAQVPAAAPVYRGRAFERLFGENERVALQVAAHDDRYSLDPSAWWPRLRQRLFGLRTPLPFADARLEAIRRLGVAARVGGRRAVTLEVEAARVAGLPRQKIDAVLLAFGRVAPIA